MKNLVTVVLFIILAFTVSGQATCNDSHEDFLAAMKRNRSYRAHIAAKNITSVQTFGYKKNNPDGVLLSLSKYDNRGNNTDWVQYKQGKVKKHNTATYNDSNRITSYAHYKRNGKLKEMGTTTYNKSGDVIESDYYKKNPQAISSKTIKTYDTRNNLTESKTFGKKGKLTGRIEYSYYDDGSKKQTIRYSAKGKVVRIWNFDCNPVGTPEMKNFKDTSKICIHYEKDKDGNPIKVKEEYEGGAGWFGSTIRYITKYDKDNNMVDATATSLKGNQIYHWSASYNASGQMTEYTLYKAGTRQPWYKASYTYNNDGNIAESVIYKNSQQPFSTEKYVYTSSLSSPAK